MSTAFDVTMVLKLGADLTGAIARIEPMAEIAVAKTALAGVAQAKLRAPVRTGNLRSSISADIRGLEAVFGPTAHYGVYLEFGTSRMSPRPFLGPALDDVTPGFVAAMQAIGGSIL